MGKKLTRIINDYRDSYNIMYTKDSNCRCIPMWGLICIPNKYRREDFDNYLFSVLHEVGHCETFKDKQTEVEKEFLATQWASDNAKRYDVKIDNKEQDEWQNYIYSFITTEDRSKYLLNWDAM